MWVANSTPLYVLRLVLSRKAQARQFQRVAGARYASTATAEKLADDPSSSTAYDIPLPLPVAPRLPSTQHAGTSLRVKSSQKAPATRLYAPGSPWQAGHQSVDDEEVDVASIVNPRQSSPSQRPSARRRPPPRPLPPSDESPKLRAEPARRIWKAYKELLPPQPSFLETEPRGRTPRTGRRERTKLAAPDTVAELPDQPLTPTAFLEPEDDEYSKASRKLPFREPAPNWSDLRWPTVFPPRDELSSGQLDISPGLPCDSVARAVEQKDFDRALTLLRELRKRSISIKPRHIYLGPAIAALEANPPRPADFLTWWNFTKELAVAPSYSGVKKRWDPIIFRIMRDFPLNSTFIGAFLKQSARLGYLPIHFSPLMSQLLMCTSTKTAMDIARDAMQIYRKQYYTGSTREQALFRMQWGHNHVNDMWNRLLRSIFLAGYTETADALYRERPDGAVWSSFTERLISRTAWAQVPTELTRDERAVFDVQWSKKSLSRRIRQVIKMCEPDGDLPATGAWCLADVITGLEQADRPSLLEALQDRILRPMKYRRDGPPAVDRLTMRIEQSLWVHANIIVRRDTGQDKEACQLFGEHYAWDWLPDHPLKPKLEHLDDDLWRTPDETEGRMMTRPPIEAITTILHPLLKTLPGNPDDVVLPFASTLLERGAALPPRWRPDEAFVANLIRCVGHVLSYSEAAQEQLLELLRIAHRLGFELGDACHHSLVTSLAAKTHWGLLVDHLAQMEASLPEQHGEGEHTVQADNNLMEHLPTFSSDNAEAVSDAESDTASAQSLRPQGLPHRNFAALPYPSTDNLNRGLILASLSPRTAETSPPQTVEEGETAPSEADKLPLQPIKYPPPTRQLYESLVILLYKHHSTQAALEMYERAMSVAGIDLGHEIMGRAMSNGEQTGRRKKTYRRDMKHWESLKRGNAEGAQAQSQAGTSSRWQTREVNGARNSWGVRLSGGESGGAAGWDRPGTRKAAETSRPSFGLRT